MESYSNSIEYYLTDGLSFKLKPGASYVTERKSATFNSIGGQTFVGGTGTRLVKINIADSSTWLDPSTVRIFCTLKYLDNAIGLRTTSGPWSFIRRARCLFQGTVTDDILDYYRTYQMLHILQSKNRRDNDDVEGFGYRRDDDEHNYLDDTNIIPSSYFAIGHTAADNMKPVNFRRLMGILNQNKYLRLMWGGLEVKLEIVADALDRIAYLGGGGSSTRWEISDICVKADTIVLDNTLQNEYANHVLRGKPLPINYLDAANCRGSRNKCQCKPCCYKT